MVKSLRHYIMHFSFITYNYNIPYYCSLRTKFQTCLVILGGWSIFPLLPALNKYTEESKWFIFLAENSRVNLKNLDQTLSRYQSDYGIFLGHALNNLEILHPDYSSGFAISTELLKMFNIERIQQWGSQYLTFNLRNYLNYKLLSCL